MRDILKNNLKNSGIPKGLEKDFKKGVKIIDANKVSTKSIKEAIANIAVTDETIFVKISKITEPPYSDIWVYPKGTRAQVKSRIKELKALGVESISFQGKLKIW